MIRVTLYGKPACRRYQRMRELVLTASEKTGIPIELKEIGDTESLSKINPLSLPCLHVGENLVAVQNPPGPQVIEMALAKVHVQ
jgi:hypothetical protein